MDIDKRSVKDIENRISELSSGYVPEWQYDPEHADIGGAIAKLFALQMKETIDLENHVMDQYHAEFVNMMDLSLKAAKPAGSMVKFDLIENTIPGTQIRKGTKLIAGSADTGGNQIIFETDREVYVTNSRITDMFMTDREEASFVPLLGQFAPVSLLEGEVDMTRETDESISSGRDEEDSEKPGSDNMIKLRPFVLFSEVGSITRSALVIYHESLFDIENEPIYIRMTGNEEMIQNIRDGVYVFRYYTASGFEEFDTVVIHDDGVTVELKKSKVCTHMIVEGKSYAVVTLEASKIVINPLEISSIGLSSSGQKRSADFVSDGGTDLDVEEFAPFSDTMSVYNECYVGYDQYFSKGGSRITLSFHMAHGEKSLFLTKQEEQANLKIIKKKPKMLPSEIPVDAYCDEICIEYFNGLGWKKLPFESDVSTLLSGAGSGVIQLSFICPNDWAKVQAGAYFGRAVRLRLLKSDNCYIRPGIHHYPIIQEFRAEFTYEGNFAGPGRLYRIGGTKKDDITDLTKKDKKFVAMLGGSYSDDALYLGFNEPMEGGPISVYFEIEDQLNMNELKCRFEYSATEGFKPLKVVDNTKDFSRSGTVTFMPPSDMHNTLLENRRRYWIRIRRNKVNDRKEKKMFLPHISNVMMNVVNVSNIVTGVEKDFYISDTSPNQHFALGQSNILDLEVWVNEKRNISRDEIEKMQSDHPDDIRVETDMLGGYSAVYVRWNEVSSFDRAPDPRSYVVDRLSSELLFSDGIKAYIPRVTDDVAFKVKIRTSNGSAGNVDTGTIKETLGTELYIENVYNPVRAYGGSDLETISKAFRRGANFLSSRGRLVTANDYTFAILEYSDSIDKVSCVSGQTVDGRKRPADVSFVLLMKDFMEGSFSFHRIAASLKQYLLERSPLTISEEHVFIVEPIFVSLSVSVWAGVKDEDDSFETQQAIVDMLEGYFNPVSTKDSDGWAIGVIPRRNQILMKLGALKKRAVIKKTSIMAHYVDKDGEHEVDIDDIEVSPFMVVRSGKHKAYIEYD